MSLSHYLTQPNLIKTRQVFANKDCEDLDSWVLIIVYFSLHLPSRNHSLYWKRVTSLSFFNKVRDRTHRLNKYHIYQLLRYNPPLYALEVLVDTDLHLATRKINSHYLECQVLHSSNRKLAWEKEIFQSVKSKRVERIEFIIMGSNYLINSRHWIMQTFIY